MSEENEENIGDLMSRLGNVAERLKDISPGGGFTNLAGGFDLGDIMKYEEAARMAALIKELQVISVNLPRYQKETDSPLVTSLEASEEYRERIVTQHYRLLDELLAKLEG